MPKQQFAPRKYMCTYTILRHMNCLGYFTLPRGSFEPTTYCYKLYTKRAIHYTTSISLRYWHWKVHLLVHSTLFFNNCHACFSGITIPYILGCQTCFSGVAMHVFLSDMPNVFFWDCNACFFRVIYNIIQFPIHNILVEENTKTRSVQSIFLQPAVRHGSEPIFLRTTIKLILAWT